MSAVSIQRRNMVDCQVRPSDVTDLRIIEAMLDVSREAFVPDSKRALAYIDLDLDVGEAGSRGRFLLKPAVLARLLQAADIGENDSVLVVGCAGGYSACIASRLAARVTATEPDRTLAENAIRNLSANGASNASVQVASPADGYAANAPYDVIVIDGATEIAPETLYQQLKPGGRLVGVFATGRPKRGMIVTRSLSDFGHRPLFDAAASVLPGLERPAAFVF